MGRKGDRFANSLTNGRIACKFTVCACSGALQRERDREKESGRERERKKEERDTQTGCELDSSV